MYELVAYVIIKGNNPMLLLIGFALFTARMFLFSISLLFVSINRWYLAKYDI